MGWFIIVGSLPIVVLGVLLKDIIEQDFRNLWIIGTTLIVMGLVLGSPTGSAPPTRRIKQITLRDAVLMGAAQALALIPGVSRSGATLSMGRFLGYEREAATRYAFLLAIPAVVGAGLFELKEIPDGDNVYGWGPTIVATVVSFVVGYAAIAWLLRYVAHPLLHAVRDLPGRARHRDAGAARRRRAHGLTARRLRLVTNRRFRGRFLRLVTKRSRYSQPDFLKQHHQRPPDGHHQQQRERVAEHPAELGHVLEVHAVDRRRSASARRPAPTPAEILRMSSFCWTEIRARWASKAVDSSASRLSTVSAIRARWSPTSRKNGAGSGRCRGPRRRRTGCIGSRSGITARRTSASSRLRM